MEGINAKPSSMDEAIIKKLNLENYTAHIFICTGPKCCSPERGEELWACLKEQTAKFYEEKGITVQRSRAQCLRVCKEGPIAVVYPSGVWLKDLQKDQIPLLLESLERNNISNKLSVIVDRKMGSL